MRLKTLFISAAAILLIMSLLFFYFNIREGVPDGTIYGEIPIYAGLKDSKDKRYVIEGDRWKEILKFYKVELHKTGWEPTFVHESDQSDRDGEGFISTWQRAGSNWELSIVSGYFHQKNETEVLFEKRDTQRISEWISVIPNEICIIESPDINDECYEINDKKTIREIISIINHASDSNQKLVHYDDKSIIRIGSIMVEVQYDLEKGIYLTLGKKTKWLKPEKEFFEITRISKEY